MSAIEAIFLYKTFLCLVYRQGQWEIRCTTYGYSYTGNGTRKDAKTKVDYFLELRADLTDREQQP
jgi:hypothetical protein